MCFVSLSFFKKRENVVWKNAQNMVASQIEEISTDDIFFFCYKCQSVMVRMKKPLARWNVHLFIGSGQAGSRRVEPSFQPLVLLLFSPCPSHHSDLEESCCHTHTRVRPLVSVPTMMSACPHNNQLKTAILHIFEMRSLGCREENCVFFWGFFLLLFFFSTCQSLIVQNFHIWSSAFVVSKVLLQWKLQIKLPVSPLFFSWLMIKKV